MKIEINFSVSSKLPFLQKTEYMPEVKYKSLLPEGSEVKYFAFGHICHVLSWSTLKDLIPVFVS